MNAKNFGHIVVFVGLFLSQVVFGTVKWKFVRVPQKMVTKEFVKEMDFIRDHKWDDIYAFGYVRADRTKRLDDEQREKVTELNAREWAENDFDAKTLLPKQKTTRDPYGPYEEYHTYTSLTAELKLLAEKFPTLATLESAGKSVEGRDLWYVKIASKTASDDNRPKLLYVSSMHGDEVVGKELLVYFIRDLLNRYGTDERITALVNNAQLYIMPSMNPDGTERHQRFNAKGVDLNRDFPELHESPFSVTGRATETKHLMELHKNNHFAIAINFHTGAVCVNIPWDSKANTSSSMFGDNTLMLELAKEYAELNKPMHDVHHASFNHGVTYGYEWYEVLGGMQDWASFFRQSTHATVELSDIKWPNASQLPTLWEHNRDSLLTYFERGLDGLHLNVVDENGKTVEGVGVDIGSAKRTITYDGFVHRPTIAGIQQVTLKAPGFITQTLSISPQRFDGTYQTVVMRK